MVDRRREEVAAGDGSQVTAALGARLYDRAEAARWSLPQGVFDAALERSVAHAFAGRERSSRDVERYLDTLHLGDLALACACAEGIDAAWEHFILDYRPALYRAAAAIDRSGGSRELADSLYAELFGLRERDGQRQSLFRYFHGRSGLGSWVRAVLAQRHIDGVRARRRLDPLPDDDGTGALSSKVVAGQGDDARHQLAMHAALAAALAALVPCDRLRLACYYAQNMKLAAIGRMLGEHEATVSRHLTRIRQQIRTLVEQHLRVEAGYDEAAVTECFTAVAGDSGGMDLAVMLGAAGTGKNRGTRSFSGQGDV